MDLDNLAPIVLLWILQFKEISCIIPGTSKPEHVLSNLSVYETPQLTADQISKMNAIYEAYIKEEVHQGW